jgi:hypothetical protein
MTLPVAPNAISMTQIKTEFEGSVPISLSDYYGLHASLPASGEIAMGDFHGLQYQTDAIDLDGGEVGVNGSGTPAQFSFLTDGSVYWAFGIANGTHEFWSIPDPPEQSDYEIRFTKISGTFNQGLTSGVWYAFNVNRYPSASADVYYTAAIRRDGGAILASANYRHHY